jgi:hypothetical protein
MKNLSKFFVEKICNSSSKDAYFQVLVYITLVDLSRKEIN